MRLEDIIALEAALESAKDRAIKHIQNCPLCGSALKNPRIHLEKALDYFCEEGKTLHGSYVDLLGKFLNLPRELRSLVERQNSEKAELGVLEEYSEFLKSLEKEGKNN
jgi:hypothetical protein